MTPPISNGSKDKQLPECRLILRVDMRIAKLARERNLTPVGLSSPIALQISLISAR